jgi:hypothetical protein
MQQALPYAKVEGSTSARAMEWLPKYLTKAGASQTYLASWESPI